MLGVRLADGLALRPGQRAAARELVADGLLEPRPDRAVLTDRGRRLADVVIRALA